MAVVLHVVYSGLSGMVNVCFSLIEADRDPDNRHAIAFFGIEPVLEDYRHRCAALGVAFTSVRKRAGPDLRALLALRRQIRDARPDAVIVNVPSTLDAALWARRRLPGMRVIGVEHHSNALKGPREWLHSLRLARRCDAVVYLTDTYRDEVAARLGRLFAPRRAAVIPNGIDTTLFSPDARAEAVAEDGGRALRLGMCARLSSDKDIPTLLRAVARLAADPGRAPIELLIAGDGPLRAEHEALATALGIDAVVDFLGLLDERGLLHCLRSLDLYVHATRNETMSTSVMQALATGLPVVASDISGMDALVDDTVGTRVPPADAEALAAAIGALLDDAERRLRLGSAARRRALERLSSARAWEAYSELAFGPR